MEESQPPLNFSELKHGQKADDTTANQPSVASSSAGRNALPPRFAMDPNNTNPYVRFATDAIGQELQPHASIWSMYVEEASEQDAELVDVQNKNLDLMLLFAALFSAILTAFLIESTNMLQQDSVDASAALLLFIAQSQRRMELGIPAQTLDPVDITGFSPTLSSRFINGLWFTALAFSLSAALVAMLAKEWLAAYLASSVRPAYDRALARQVRFDGLVAWGALPIISFLPTLLHLSLLFFSLGLVIYLWDLDTGIAIVVLIITGLTLAFYIITLFLGALFEPCPFVTQLSKYCRTGFKAYFKDWSPRRAKVWAEAIISHSSIEQTESHALSWLVKNSHDPAVVDCAYQAVASHIGANTKQGDEFHEISLTTAQDSDHRATLDNHVEPPKKLHLGTSDNIVFFVTICGRLSELIRQGPKAGFVDQGLSTAVARYALALPKILRHIIDNVGIERATQCIQYATETNICINSGDPSPINLASTALKDIEIAFSNQWGPMSADMYALLGASHLELTEIVASTLRIHTPPPSRTRSPLGTLPLDRPRANRIGGPSVTAISLLRPSRREHLLQSSRAALARTSNQLHYHLNTAARISHVHLTSLLKSVSKVMACTQLKIEAGRMIDTAGADTEAPGEDHLELSLLLTQTIIKMLQDTQTARVPEFFSIANQVLAATTSLYATKKPEGLTADYWSSLRTDALAYSPPVGIDMLPLPPTIDPNQVVVIRQVLALSALPLTAYNCLPVTALHILYDQVKDTPTWFNLWGSLHHGQLVEQWIQEAYKLQFDCSVERSEELAKMARRSTLGIIGYVLLSKVEQLLVNWLDISWDTCLFPLLYLISSTPDQPELEIMVILDYLADSDQHAFESLIKFFRSSKGFSTLRSIRRHTVFYYQTTRVIIALLDSRRLQVSEDNVNDMLEEVNFSSEILGRNTDEATDLIEGALHCLAEAHHKGIVLPWDHRFIVENNLENRIREYIEDEPSEIIQSESNQSKDTFDREN
ncbi:unnamed protein product [Rhizoctonia solani]|uniref:DUF6535 domain-containing protein n=1 Tax=Rhizoctonia solani TaxID=456999 RepID=A0A8H2XTP5_9AGAM|nr:unnamed protein product [Rhizoctonia solani]